ncbi:hypothetical protein [Paraburkholderia tagetis]|uniref:Uncharacterized protein n=1 Tax=Paraburkholderia tagetis TaxID=2913261 RepID=A0A9X1RIG5_9BURK|nr:hypothetical protein [Paraburkholderia tagetis]MCG5071833.1 hypothetical protein [Paraburkholderia tagetis]
MFRVQSTKFILLLVTVFGFGVTAFAQQSTADQEPAVEAGQTQPVQVAATEAVHREHAVIAVTPAPIVPASNKAPKCVGPASFCNIYFGN